MTTRRLQILVVSLLAVAAAIVIGGAVRTWTWVRDRREIVAESRLDTPYDLRSTEGGQAPELTRLMGEHGYATLEIEFENRPPEFQLNSNQRRIVERYRRLFPEAEVVVIPLAERRLP